MPSYGFKKKSKSANENHSFFFFSKSQGRLVKLARNWCCVLSDGFIQCGYYVVCIVVVLLCQKLKIKFILIHLKSHIFFWLLSYSASQRWLCTVDKMVKKKKLLKDILFYYVGGGVVVYYSRYIFLLCYLYYFIVLNAKIKLLILGVL